MGFSKNKIAANFNRACLSYDSVATVQRACAHHLIELLRAHHPTFAPQTILDIGAGTGFVAEQVQKLFPSSHLILNDIAPLMLNRATRKLQENSFTIRLGDMETLAFAPQDMIISNLAFQWATDLFSLLDTLYKQTDVLAFNCLLSGSFQEWAQRFAEIDLPSPLHPYPSQSTLEQHLRAYGTGSLVTDVQKFTLSFPHGRAFINYLKDLGANLGNRSYSVAQRKRILERCKDPFQATYHVFFGLLKRKH